MELVGCCIDNRIVGRNEAFLRLPQRQPTCFANVGACVISLGLGQGLRRDVVLLNCVRRAVSIKAEAQTGLLEAKSARRLVPGWRKAGNLASRWREIAGEKNWDGLLEELDPDLKREILKCGDFIWPIYDSIDINPESLFRGSSHFHPSRLLDEVRLFGTGYKVTKYIYMLGRVDFVRQFGSFFKQITGDDDDGGEFWSKDSSWVGLIAVATDEEEIARLGRRDIIIAFRGTHTPQEWMLNFFDLLLPVGVVDKTVPWHNVVKVEAGFLDMYTNKSEDAPFNQQSMGEQVLEEVNRLILKYKDQGELSISVTGHSLGAALGVICAYDLAHSGTNRLSVRAEDTNADIPEATDNEAAGVIVKIAKNILTTVKTLLPGVVAEKSVIPQGFLPGTVPITVYTFGGPRAGNDDFREAIHALGVKVLRVENAADIVPKMPGLLFNEWTLQKFGKYLNLFFDSFPWTYIHAGIPLEVSHKDSPYLDDNPEFSEVHDIEVYLHLVDGYESKIQRFNTKSGEQQKDYVLVNKNASILKQQYRIPSKWFQLANKGLIFNATTQRYELRPRSHIDLPINCIRPIDLE